MSQEQTKAVSETTAVELKVTLTNITKTNAELVFAYRMRDQIAVRGVVAVQKEFPAWFQGYVADKLEQEAKAINDRIEQKKWNMVTELQKKFGYSLEDAKKQVFGNALVNQPNTVHKAA